LFRIADAVRVSHLYLCGATPTPPNATIAKVGRAKEHNVPWSYENSAEETIIRLKQDNYSVIALELTENARPYYAVNYSDRVCLVLGNEDHGVTRSALELCDLVIFIPMYGKGQSLNVHVSAAVVLYHMLHPQRE
jgi:tRNA (guanosine-2'-O-)-methyltransferase